MQQVSVVIMDLDNTLYDWVNMWYRAFSAMLDKLVAQSGVPRETLLRDIQSVYRKHGTSEYAFLIEELATLAKRHPGVNVAEQYREAIEAYQEARDAALQLYPGTRETLASLKERGCLLVVYTESMEFYTMMRVRRLSLDGMIDYLYSPRDHPLPEGVTREAVRQGPPSHYELLSTEHRHVPEGEHKPNPAILLQIIDEVGASKEQSVYVGDSLYQDVLMAQDAGVTDVHAAYGVAQDSGAYALLRQVSHWTDEMIEEDRRLHETRSVAPTYVLKEGLAEILDRFEFVPFAPER